MKFLNSKKGFTLIELLVVIGILAVLAAIAIPSVAGLIDRANVSADKTNANEMTNAMERFAAEYELYCQDIASGVIKADTTDFDAAQGRVYNVTGALSRSDIETLEVAQGATVADDQIAIYRDTKYPVNAMTAKSIVMNYTKTSSSTFEPKQSDMHFWYSPDCGVVVFAEPNADVVTQLNVQILSGKDAKGNELGASTKWIDLTADTTAVVTHAMLNKTDVLDGYNTAYFRSAGNFDNFVAVKVDGNVVDGSNYTLSEGSTVVVLKPEFVQTLSEGEHTMEIQSTDGSATCEFTVELDTSTEFKYKNKKFHMGYQHLVVQDDNTILVIDFSGNQLATIPSVCVSTTRTTITIVGVGSYDGTYTVTDDGFLVRDGEAMAIMEGKCTHQSNSDMQIRVFYEFVDDNNEIVDLRNVHALQELKQYELKCMFCYEKIPFRVYDDSDFLYIWNGYLEPQMDNGKNVNYTVDIDSYNVGGWVAILYDMAKSNNPKTIIDGQPVVDIQVSHGATIPKGIKYIFCSLRYFDDKYNIPDDIEMTFCGTKAELSRLNGRPFENGKPATTLLVDDLQDEIKYGWGSRKNSITIHCTDGDFVLSNY